MRGDISGDDGRRVFRSQKTSHSSFRNCGENVDRYLEVDMGLRQSTLPTISNMILVHCWFLYGNGDAIGEHRSHTSHLPSHKYG